MKVSEAKEKVCPFIQTPVDSSIRGVYLKNIRCICEDCMAWVWKIEYTNDKFGILIDVYDSTTEGYCARISNE